MEQIMNFPVILGLCALIFLWASARLGVFVRGRMRTVEPSELDEFGTVLGATLTLLGLLIGFTFSMAISRYDQRKNLEEAEANAIGTEFLRAGLLPAADATKVRALLHTYYEQRILFYTTRDSDKLREVNAQSAQLQGELWAAVIAPAASVSTPTIALAVAGMNDVLNAQGYTQAAWWNRIPRAAWILMLSIAVCCHLLIGFGVRDRRAELPLLLALPLVMSISFFLIADIDSPRGGFAFSPRTCTPLPTP